MGSGLQPLSLKATSEGGLTVIAVSGELDLSGAERFRLGVREQLAVGPALLDLHELSFMDSSGVRALDELLGEAKREDWSLVIRSDLRPNVRKILEITGLLGELPLQGSASPSDPR